MIKHAGNTNSNTKTMVISGSGTWDWKNHIHWNALQALQPIPIEFKNNENNKSNSVDMHQFVLLFIYRPLAFTDEKQGEMLDFKHLLCAESCLFLYIINELNGVS